MRITDYISSIFRRRTNVLIDSGMTPYASIMEGRHAFGNTVFFNIVDLLTDLVNDVTFTNKDEDKNTMLFAEFNMFFTAWGQVVLSKIFADGFVVIGHSITGFRILNCNEYRTMSDTDKSIVEANDSNTEVYVMRSQAWMIKQLSDKQLLFPFIEYLDNVLNASNTASARLGNIIVGSPKNAAAAPTAVVLTKEQKEALETEIQTEYGALKEQKQIMLLPREMSFQTISLAGLDMHTTDKVKMAILAICDRVKVPANQVAIIDANSSKSLSNGTELREGDFSKYQSFERLLNRTFVQMAKDMGLHVDYEIYNKPTRQIQQGI